MHRHQWKKPEEGDIFKYCGCGKRKKIIVKEKKSTVIRKMDALWSRLTKEIHIHKHGRICLWCKKESNLLQSDHIFTRSRHMTRWNVENCVVLDRDCHLFYKKRNQIEWGKMVLDNIGEEKYEELRKLSYQHAHYKREDLLEILEYLKKLDVEKPWLI